MKGHPTATSREKLGAAPSTVSRWKQRYKKDGGWVWDHPSRPAPQKITPQLRAKVLDLGLACEIDDRLLAPLPFGFVAIEKVLFAAMRGVIGL